MLPEHALEPFLQELSQRPLVRFGRHSLEEWKHPGERMQDVRTQR